MLCCAICSRVNLFQKIVKVFGFQPTALEVPTSSSACHPSLGMGQIRAGSEMAEMARLPPLLAQAQPSLVQDQAWPRIWHFSKPICVAGV